MGSHLAEALLGRGDRVVIVDDLNPFYDPAIKRSNLEQIRRSGDFVFREGDIRDQRLMEEVLAEHGADGIVHLAAMAGVRPSIERPAEYVSVNLHGSAVVFDVAVRHRVPRVVFISSSSVYGNASKVPFHEDDPVDQPVSPYAATKKAGELLAHTYHHLHGIDVACLRLFTVYGPRQRPEMAIHRFTAQIARGEPIPFFGDGSSSRDYTYVADIVDGILGAMDCNRGYRIYNLGGSATITLEGLVALIEEAVGRRAVLDRLPAQAGDVNRTYADIGRARAELGYDPEVSVAEGIPRFVAWFQEHRS